MCTISILTLDKFPIDESIRRRTSPPHI